jgi:hypothetical protein
MFRSISENPHKPAGKQANDLTRKMIATQYSLGKPEWADKWQSNTQGTFAKVIHIYDVITLQPQDPPKYNRVQKVVGSQICFGTDKVDFLSNTKQNFGPAPQGYERAKPLRDKATLMASSYKVDISIVIRRYSSVRTQ